MKNLVFDKHVREGTDLFVRLVSDSYVDASLVNFATRAKRFYNNNTSTIDDVYSGIGRAICGSFLHFVDECTYNYGFR